MQYNHFSTGIDAKMILTSVDSFTVKRFDDDKPWPEHLPESLGKKLMNISNLVKQIIIFLEMLDRQFKQRKYIYDCPRGLVIKLG